LWLDKNPGSTISKTKALDKINALIKCDWRNKQHHDHACDRFGNILEHLLRPMKNGGKKQKRMLAQAQSTVNRAKKMKCYFFNTKGYCVDGANCYFNHPQQLETQMYGNISQWYKNVKNPYGYIKSIKSNESWSFQKNNLDNNFPKNVEVGMKVKVGKLMNESEKSRRATGISVCTLN